MVGTRRATVWILYPASEKKDLIEKDRGFSLFFEADLVAARLEELVQIWLEELLRVESLERRMVEPKSMGSRQVVLELLRNASEKRGSHD